MIRLLLCAYTIGSMFMGFSYLSAGPRLLYRGSLVDSQKTPVGGIYWMRFSLHRDAATRGAVWVEELYVGVDEGNYIVELGRRRPLPVGLKLDTLYLAIAIDGVEVLRVPVTEEMIIGQEESSTNPQCLSCQRAKIADNAKRLDGLSVKQLTSLAAKRTLKLGKKLRYTSQAGPGIGDQFRLLCPPGFVVVGLKGGVDDSIRNIQLICSPLEIE